MNLWTASDYVSVVHINSASWYMNFIGKDVITIVMGPWPKLHPLHDTMIQRSCLPGDSFL